MKYIVVLTRHISESEFAEAVVEAETEQQARDIALDSVDRDRLAWSRNQDFDSDTEVTSVSPASEDDALSELDPQ